MAKNCGEWGRDKARERYQYGGEVPLPRRDPRKIAPDKKGNINIGSGVGYKDGGGVPEHPSPPLQPSEWPPHPLDRKRRGR